MFVYLLHLVLLSAPDASRDAAVTDVLQAFMLCFQTVWFSRWARFSRCLQMDSILYAEFLMWKENPGLERSSAFLSRVYREDIGPCLSFTRSEVRMPARAPGLDNDTSAVRTSD